MISGVVSVMVAKNVAWFIGAFHSTWMSKAANSWAWIRSGSWSRRPGSCGSSSSRSISSVRGVLLMRTLS